MKTMRFLASATFGIFGFGSLCCPINAAGPSSPRQEFEAIASNLMDKKHGWDGGEGAKVSQGQVYDRLYVLAGQMMAKPDYAATILALLEEYKDHDGYPRQQLLRAIFNSERFTVSDVPFYKAVFLASLHFHYDKAPQYVNWYTPMKIQDHLATGILSLQGHTELIGKDYALLNADPVAWLNKHVP